MYVSLVQSLMKLENMLHQTVFFLYHSLNIRTFQRRFLSDREVNNRQYSVARTGTLETKRCADIIVGDLVLVKQDQEVPADCILLKSSSKDDGIVYVDTANLDGEVNLKQYRAFGQTHSLSQKKILSSAKGIVECEYPTQDLYSLKANFRVDTNDDKLFPLNAKSTPPALALLLPKHTTYSTFPSHQICC